MRLRIDRDFVLFAAHCDWFVFMKYVGYVPTAIAPADAVSAMERFNQRTYHTPPKRFRRVIRLTQRHTRLAAALVGWGKAVAWTRSRLRR